jgi:uncharacterized protein with HEPN domain
MKDPALYLVHIVECIDKVVRYTALGESSLADPLVYDAVLRNLQTLSEASQKLPDAIKLRHPSIPWSSIGGFRNILVHDYLGGVDPGIVWRVIATELPPLRKAVLSELPGWPLKPA